MPVNNKLYGGLINTTGNAMSLRMARQGMIQSNVANMETPGYKVQELPFAKVMDSVMTGRGELSRTHAGHIALDPIEVGRNLEFHKEDRPVDLDEEMVKLSENQLLYQVSTRIIAKKFEGLRYAIDEGGK